MSRRQVPKGDARVGELISAGWLSVTPMASRDWRAVARLRSTTALLRGNGAAGGALVSWATWDRQHLGAPRLVARLEDRVVGWAALAPVSLVPAYSGVAEVRIQVDPAVQRCGIGRHLLTRLIAESEAQGLWSLRATIIGDGGGGLYLHRRCGFRVVGTRERVAFVAGEWHGEVLMERRSRTVGADASAEAKRPGPGTPEYIAACNEAARLLAPIFLEVAIQEHRRAKVLGIDQAVLDEQYKRGERTREEDDRLVEQIEAEQLEQRMREWRQRWDDEVREEIDRRKRDGLPYEHILGYFD